MRGALALVAALAVFLAGLEVGAAIGQPHLVGTGCIGANGPIYAESESDFPQCITIERN